MPAPPPHCWVGAQGNHLPHPSPTTSFSNVQSRVKNSKCVTPAQGGQDLGGLCVPHNPTSKARMVKRWGGALSIKQHSLLLPHTEPRADPGSVQASPPYSRSHFAQTSSSRTDCKLPRGHKKGCWHRQLQGPLEPPGLCRAPPRPQAATTCPHRQTEAEGWD